jgi:hypothetical protein
MCVQEGSGFRPLPKVGNSTDQDATDVKKYVTRWRTYNVTAESSTTEQEWRERQEAVRVATQVRPDPGIKLVLEPSGSPQPDQLYERVPYK